jgi:hypothetical protein
MPDLPTVEPDGIRVVDEDGEDRNGGVRRHGHEARFNASDVGHDAVDWDTRVAESGLRYGVVLRKWILVLRHCPVER